MNKVSRNWFVLVVLFLLISACQTSKPSTPAESRKIHYQTPIDVVSEYLYVRKDSGAGAVMYLEGTPIVNNTTYFENIPSIEFAVLPEQKRQLEADLLHQIILPPTQPHHERGYKIEKIEFGKLTLECIPKDKIFEIINKSSLFTSYNDTARRYLHVVDKAYKIKHITITFTRDSKPIQSTTPLYGLISLPGALNVTKRNDRLVVIEDIFYIDLEGCNPFKMISKSESKLLRQASQLVHEAEWKSLHAGDDSWYSIKVSASDKPKITYHNEKERNTHYQSEVRVLVEKASKLYEKSGAIVHIRMEENQH